MAVIPSWEDVFVYIIAILLNGGNDVCSSKRVKCVPRYYPICMLKISNEFSYIFGC